MGFRLGDDGLIPIAGGEAALSDAGADPAQIGFTPDGSALIVTERGTDAIEIVLRRLRRGARYEHDGGARTVPRRTGSRSPRTGGWS